MILKDIEQVPCARDSDHSGRRAGADLSSQQSLRCSILVLVRCVKFCDALNSRKGNQVAVSHRKKWRIFSEESLPAPSGTSGRRDSNPRSRPGPM